MISQGRIKIGIVLFILLNTVMLNAVIQTELRNGEWQLIGFMGPQDSAASGSYNGDLNREVIDIADANTTYLVKESNGANGQLAYKTGILDTNLATTYTGTTTQIGSSIGIFAIKNQQSPSGETTLASTEATAVKMKIANPKQFIINLPKYRMYIKGKSAPAVRVDYQANYEGQKISMKFGSETKDYVVYFNHANTFMYPAIPLNSADIEAGQHDSLSTLIQDAIDFDTSDNNITEMLINNKYSVKDTAGVYNKDLTDFSSSTDYQATVYRFSNGAWEVFDSRNAKQSSNAFDKFNTGKGYWVKIDNAATARAIAGEELIIPKTGLITSSSAIIKDNAYMNAKTGWNLLSFKDTNIRYAPSGVFIPQNVWNRNDLFGGVRLFFKSEGRSNGVLSGNINLGTTIDNNYSDTNSAARAINLAMQVKNDISSEFQKIRAIPAIDFNATGGDSTPGIIILSDGLFEINTSGNTTTGAPLNQVIKTIAKGKLKQLANGNYGSAYGEYMNFININTALDASRDVNASLSVYIHNGNSAAQKTNALNDGNNSNRLINVLDAFTRAATKNGETAPYTRTAGYLATVNFNAVTDYTDDNNMTHMLIASGERYSISDSTFTKVYKYKDGGKFTIVSSKGSTNVDSSSATDATGAADTVAIINAQTATTGVRAIDLGQATGTTNLYFAIMSTEKGLELLENDSKNLFEDIALTDGAIPNIARTRGAITTVHSTKNLFDTSVVINRDVIDGNVSYFGVFDVSYAKNFEDNKTFEHNRSGGTLAATAWGDQTVYFTDSDFNLTGDHTIGGDLIIENSTIRLGKATTASLTVNGKIITIGSTVTLDLNRSSLVRTGFFNNRDKNATANAQLYPTGETITFNADVNLSNIDINGTKIKYASLDLNGSALDKTVSGTPVGLFNLNGADFPSLKSDLQSDSHWVLDFPLQGGLIEDMKNTYGREINSVLTMDYSSANEGSGEAYWRNTDLTKNIDTLYGNAFNTDNDKDFNNDYQGIFRIQPNKAYWVNLGKAETITKQTIKDIINVATSGVTHQAKVHLSNTFSDKLIATTQNHINNQLNVKFSSLVNGNSAYYNVVAIVAGKRYYLKRKGNIFSLGINDNEMAIKAGTYNNKKTPIFLEVYDGEGSKVVEKDATKNQFNVVFYKPTTPMITWNDKGYLQATTTDDKTAIELYASPVSDIEAERDKKRLKSTDLSESNITQLEWNFDANVSLKGGLTPIRIIAKSTEYGFYSDMKSILYAPINKGHVLTANLANPKAIVPFSYLQGQYLTRRVPNKKYDHGNGVTKNYPEFDGTKEKYNGVNGGVQLNIIKSSVDITGITSANKNIKIAYYPDGETEGAKSLTGTGFGGSRVMYLRVNTGATNTNVIASITYLPGYENKIFYISFNGKLYQGRFASTDAHSNDGNAYNLEGGDIKPSSFINSPSQATIGGTSGLAIQSGTGAGGVGAQIMKSSVEKNDPEPEPENGGDGGGNNNGNTAGGDGGQLP